MEHRGRLVRRLLPVAATVLIGLVATTSAQGASKFSVSGRLLNLPRHQRGLSVVVEAVSLDSGEAVAAKVVKGGSYSLSVPSGPYLILETVLDPRRHRTRVAYKAVGVRRSVSGVNLSVHDALARFDPAVASGGASNTDIGVKNIAINGPDGRLPGGASAGLISGLLPVCHARGARVYDETSAFEEALLTEKRIAAQGLLDTTFTYNQPDPNFLITGAVDVGHNRAPRADITLNDLQSGESRHFIVAGDPESWDDLGGFMRHIGSSIANNIADHQIACDMASEPPPPPPPSSDCHASKGTVCVAFAGEASGHVSSPHTFGTYRDMKDVSWDLTWTAKFKGYGVPTELSPSSHADGSGSVTYSNESTCETAFALIPSYPPSLAQGPPYNSKHELTIKVPNPLDDSAGTGTGNPSIGPTTSCPAQVGAGPGNFEITVPLEPHTVRYLTIPARDEPISGPYGATGSSSLDGTITVEVG